MIFTADRHKFIAGFENGLLRVYPLENDSETVFNLDMLGSYWEFNMHDNDAGISVHYRIFIIWFEIIGTSATLRVPSPYVFFHAKLRIRQPEVENARTLKRLKVES